MVPAHNLVLHQLSFALSRPVSSPAWYTVILILPRVYRGCLLNSDSTSIRQALCSHCR